jgi:hypothetical protein
MPDRAAKFVSAIFVSALAGAALAAVTHDAARAADDCLAAPKNETPDGSHWYYRIEHSTKRHCWYLRGEGEKLSQTAEPNSSAAAKPVAAAPMQRSVADARAEWPQQTSIEPPRRNDAPAMPANPAASQDNAAGADAPQSVVASRWPDSPAAGSTASPPAPADQVAANMQAANVQQAANMQSASPSDSPPSDSSQSATPQSDSAPSDATAAAPPPAAAAVPLATADSSQGLPASLPVLLAVMSGALALAGITASLVLKFGGARRTARRRVRRTQIWESMDNDNIRLPAHPDDDVVPRRPFPRDLDQAAEPNDRVADFYAQISKRARS